MSQPDFDYHLPEELIAQHPTRDRADSRLLVLERATGRITHSTFRDLPAFLSADDLLVLNDTRVFPARLFGRTESSRAELEVLLLNEVSGDEWEVLLKPARKARAGMRLWFADGFEAEVLPWESGMTRRLRFHASGDFWEWIEKLGHTPLPPYIRRGRTESAEDRERYQTVFARVRGSVAAPTAGLHFTPEVLARFRHTAITLHVGYGTFMPVKVDDPRLHQMHSEHYELSEDAASALRAQQAAGGRIVAVGTTTTRVLEHVARTRGRLEADSGQTDLFIYPGFDFRVIGALITNFHLPQSTLLMLVCAFAGTEPIRSAYEEAIRERYRFYSYGDAMLIL